MGSEGATRISYNEFLQLVNDNKVEEVNVRSDRLEIKLKDTDAIRYTGITEENTALTQRLLDAGVTVNGYIPDSSGMVISFLLSYMLPIAFRWIIMGFIFRRAGSGGPGCWEAWGQEHCLGVCTEGYRRGFADVAGKMRPKSPCRKLWISCITRGSMSRSAPSSPGSPADGPSRTCRPCLPRLSRVRRTPSSR